MLLTDLKCSDSFFYCLEIKFKFSIIYQMVQDQAHAPHALLFSLSSHRSSQRHQHPSLPGMHPSPCTGPLFSVLCQKGFLYTPPISMPAQLVAP